MNETSEHDLSSCELSTVTPKQNFTEREKILLAQLVHDYRDIIENKKTGAVTVQQKNQAWEKVTNSFNSQGFSKRTEKQLRKLWENLKQRKRRETTELRRKRLLTGGGPSVPETSDPVLKFICETAPNADVELPCAWDSTAVYEKKHCNKEQEKENVEYELEYLDECPMDQLTKELSIEKDDGSSKVTPSSSTQPSAVSTKSRKRKYGADDEEKLLRIQKLKEAIEQQRELHQKRLEIAEIETNIARVKLKHAMSEFEKTTGDRYVV